MSFTEIKQELSNSEEHEDGSVKSTTSPNHFNYQLTAIKQEESSTGKAEHSVHLNIITSLTCQVKTEPQSEGEDDYELESTAGVYLDASVIKGEITEVHTEDHHMMADEVNHWKTTEDEDGTEANRFAKPESDNWSPNFSDNNSDEQKNIPDLTTEMNQQQICGRISEEAEISHLQGKTLRKRRKNHKCSVCAKTFQSRQACLQHICKVAYPYCCEVCGKGFKYLSKLQNHKKVHSKRPSSCNVSNKAFKRKSLRNPKVSSHSNERPYSCDMCDQAFKQKGHLTRHKTRIHSAEMPYSCDLCKRTFKVKENLYAHIKIIHSDKRPYSCDLCNKTFKLKRNLRIHKRLCHSDERPYSCELCKMTFKLKMRLNNHVTTVHSNERPYSCDVCNKAFKRKNALRSHKVSCHSEERPYSCDMCDKAFKCKNVLQTHRILSHSNERPYSCDLCKKTFKMKKLLNLHIRTVHSKENPCPVDVCEKGF